jgi:hypothetical protein
VDVVWTNSDFDEDEINIPTEEGYKFIGATIGVHVLWNKSDIVLDMPTSASQPSHPLSSPWVTRVMTTMTMAAVMTTTAMINNNAGGSGTSPLGSPPPGNSNPQGGTGAASMM